MLERSQQVLLTKTQISEGIQPFSTIVEEQVITGGVGTSVCKHSTHSAAAVSPAKQLG